MTAAKAPPPIEGYRLAAVHTFQVRTLRSLGYRTRVALSNASDRRPELATAYRIDVSVFGPTGARERTFADVGTVEPGKKLLIDAEPFVDGYDRDVAIIFHLVPLRIAASAVDGLVTIARDELFFLFNVQDHYVEYYRDDGFAAGVLYQSGAFNYEKFSRERSSFLQAPKGYVARDVDTIFSVMNTSLAERYDHVAELKCTLVHGASERKHTWIEQLPPFQPVSISMRDRASALGIALSDDPEFVCFMGACETATLVPLTINRDLRTGCIGVEHSLPPLYYAGAVTGKLRARALASFARSRVFGEVT